MKLLSVEYRRLVEIFRRAALVVAPATSMALSGRGPCDPIRRSTCCAIRTRRRRP